MSDNAHSWSTEQMVDVLDNAELFKGLIAEDLRRIAEVAGVTTIQPGEILFEEGDPADAFYIVFEGAIDIVKSRADGREDKIAVCRGGDAFGEAALLDEAPRSVTARAADPTQLLRVPREGFRELMGRDSLPLRMMRTLSKALPAFAVDVVGPDTVLAPDSSDRSGAHDVSRVMQASLLPRTAPRLEGYEIAAGTTTEESGRGGSVWDWIGMDDGRVALLTLDVRQDGFPAAYHLGAARAVLRALVVEEPRLERLLARANDALSASAVEGLDQFVEVGFLLADAEGITWASAGRVPGGIIRREGSFEEFGTHGPPFGMMGGFKYNVQRFEMNVGDTAFVLSHGSQGLFLGAADLVAQLHGKPAGEVVGTLHRAIRKAKGEDRTETSVLYVRKH